jgi:3-oxoadipate enol-lactonase
MGEITTGDGVLIHYEVEGREDGPPLLFSNSLGTDLHLWDTQATEAAGLGFRVIRYDQRGHGASGAPQGAYKLERLAQDVLDLLEALGISRTAFCGLSMGGMTGIWLAMHHPRRFTRLALCNTAVWMPPRDFWETRIRDVTEGGMQAIVDGVVERWFTKAFRDSHSDEVARIRNIILTIDPGGYAGCCAAIRDMDLRDRLGSSRPLPGRNRRARSRHPPERGQYIVERIPGAQKIVLEAAHLSNIEAAAEFNRTVLGFLAVNARESADALAGGAGRRVAGTGRRRRVANCRAWNRAELER